MTHLFADGRYISEDKQRNSSKRMLFILLMLNILNTGDLTERDIGDFVRRMRSIV